MLAWVNGTIGENASEAALTKPYPVDVSGTEMLS